MTSAELTEWEAFDRINPIGPERIELMIGTLCAVAGSITSKKGLDPSKFIPDYEKAFEKSLEEGRKQSPAEMKQVLLTVAEAHNKKLRRRQKKWASE